MANLPPKSQRSLRGQDPSRNWDPASRGVIPPRIFIRLPSRGYFGHSYAEARIRVRRGGYRYLVWREGADKHEFYLGKIKIHATQSMSPATPRTGTRSSTAAARGGG